MTRRELDIGHRDFLPLAREILQSGTVLGFRVRGNSMSPFIRHQDTVLVAGMAEPARRGDVVLVKTGDGRLLLHRVVGRGGGKCAQGVITRGDACPQSDPGVIPGDDILGRVVAVRGRGYDFHLRAPWRFLLGHHSGFFFRLRRCRPLALIGKNILARLTSA